MLIDSHCHLNRIDLSEFSGSFDSMLARAAENDVKQFLSVCVGLEEYPALCDIADKYAQISISVGIHPDTTLDKPISASALIALANQHSSCIAIGETGLDYYRVEEASAQEAQRQLFREHIATAIATSKPLIIHTRQAAEDTLAVMKEEGASQIGGVMHCFSEDLSIAERAMDMNFYISMSGIVTFKNAKVLHEVAQKIPLDRMLIETDAPYLAPHPFRGKPNHPALLKYTAACIAELRQIPYEMVAEATAENFRRLFQK